MRLIRPIACLRPKREYVQQLLAPPYDVINMEEARRFVEGRPFNLLHLTKPEIDLPEGCEPYGSDVYAQAKTNYRKLLKAGVLIQETEPCYYLYRLTQGLHRQTGLVAAGSVEAYQAQRIRRHELTHPDKVEDRAALLKALNCHVSPVLLAFKSNQVMEGLLEESTREVPLYSVNMDHSVRHELWRVDRAELIEALTLAIEEIGVLYIADGHHRVAAAAQVTEACLAVLFPVSELSILGYYRIVRDLNGHSKQDLLQRLNTHFKVSMSPSAVIPSKKSHYGMYLEGQWYALELISELPSGNVLASLEVSLLSQTLLEPLFNITDPRVDPKISFIGGQEGISKLKAEIDSGRGAVGFTLFPTSMEELIKVADAANIMPPKSTWFEPKLADGLILLPIN